MTVNGKKAELIDNDLKFLSVAMEEGENVVEFTYSSPYVKYMLIGGAAAIVALCVLAFVMAKTKLVDRVAPIVAWAGIVLAVAVVAVFMVYPKSLSKVSILPLAQATSIYWYIHCINTFMFIGIMILTYPILLFNVITSHCLLSKSLLTPQK